MRLFLGRRNGTRVKIEGKLLKKKWRKRHTKKHVKTANYLDPPASQERALPDGGSCLLEGNNTANPKVTEHPIKT